MARWTTVLCSLVLFGIISVSSAEAQRWRRFSGAANTVPVQGEVILQDNAYPAATPGAPAFNESWAKTSYHTQNWDRYYHYPYVMYPHNYWPQEYFRRNGDMMRPYPPEMRIPLYDRKNYNYYPEPKRFHQGNHYLIDVL